MRLVQDPLQQRRRCPRVVDPRQLLPHHPQRHRQRQVRRQPGLRDDLPVSRTGLTEVEVRTQLSIFALTAPPFDAHVGSSIDTAIDPQQQAQQQALGATLRR